MILVTRMPNLIIFYGHFCSLKCIENKKSLQHLQGPLIRRCFRRGAARAGSSISCMNLVLGTALLIYQFILSMLLLMTDSVGELQEAECRQ
jgi:hypothetical protein